MKPYKRQLTHTISSCPGKLKQKSISFRKESIWVCVFPKDNGYRVGNLRSIVKNEAGFRPKVVIFYLQSDVKDAKFRGVK